MFLFKRKNNLTLFAFFLVFSFSTLLTTQHSAYAKTELKAILKSTWQGYKTHFIQADGRVLDPSAEDISTSEGQSYALLRAVWMNDRETFDRVYQWSINNLQTPRGDKLFAWRWGKLPETLEAPKPLIKLSEPLKTIENIETKLLIKPSKEKIQASIYGWGVLNKESASDADQDIALALILASRRWNTPQYQRDAMAILRDFWNKNTGESPAGRVLFAGDWHKPNITSELINPSYFAPYAYRIFSEVDKNPEHHWLELVDSSYFILDQATNKTRTGLPPDWLLFSLEPDKKVSLFYKSSDQRSDYGYDAIRIHWRIGMDYLLNPDEKRALTTLKKSNFLSRYWALKQKLPAQLTVDGIERNSNKQQEASLAVYGASLLGISLNEERMADGILRQHIMPSLKENSFWGNKKDYYAQNWVWLGLATYEHQQKTRYAKAIQRLKNQPEEKTLQAFMRLIQGF